MKHRFKQLYMDMAVRVSQMSRAVRLQVGAVIVKDDQIIFGYNGTAAGLDNTCEVRDYSMAGGWLDHEEIMEKWPFVDEEGRRYALRTKPEVLHAEMNSLMKFAKSNTSSNLASMFVTHSPCLDCAKAIFQAGIKEVFYKEDYRTTDGINFLNTCGVKVEKLL